MDYSKIIPDPSSFPQAPKISWEDYDRITSSIKESQVNALYQPISTPLSASPIYSPMSGQVAAIQATEVANLSMANTQSAMQSAIVAANAGTASLQTAMTSAAGVGIQSARTLAPAAAGATGLLYYGMGAAQRMRQQIMSSILAPTAEILPGVEYEIPFAQNLTAKIALPIVGGLGRIIQFGIGAIGGTIGAAIGSFFGPVGTLIGGMAGFMLAEGFGKPFAMIGEEFGERYQGFLFASGLREMAGTNIDPFAFASEVAAIRRAAPFEWRSSEEIINAARLGLMTGAIAPAYGQTLNTQDFINQLTIYRTSLKNIMRVFKVGMEQAAEIINDFQSMGLSPQQASMLAIQLGGITDWLKISGPAARIALQQGAVFAQQLGLPPQWGVMTGMQLGVTAAANLPFDPNRAAQIGTVGAAVTQQYIAQFAAPLSALGGSGLVQFATTGDPFQVILRGAANYIGGGTPTDILTSWAMQQINLQAMPPGLANLALFQNLNYWANVIGVDRNNPLAMAALLRAMSGDQLSQQQALDLYRTYLSMPAAQQMAQQQEMIAVSRQMAESFPTRLRRFFEENWIGNYIRDYMDPAVTRWIENTTFGVTEALRTPNWWFRSAVGWWRGVRYVRDIDLLPEYTPEQLTILDRAWWSSQQSPILEREQQARMQSYIRAAEKLGLYDYAYNRPTSYTVGEGTVYIMPADVTGTIGEYEMRSQTRDIMARATWRNVEQLFRTTGDILNITAGAATPEARELQQLYLVTTDRKARISLGRRLLDVYAKSTGAADYESLNPIQKMNAIIEFRKTDVRLAKQFALGESDFTPNQRRFINEYANIYENFVAQVKGVRTARDLQAQASDFIRMRFGDSLTEEELTAFTQKLIADYAAANKQDIAVRDWIRIQAETNPQMLMLADADVRVQWWKDVEQGLQNALGVNKKQARDIMNFLARNAPQIAQSPEQLEGLLSSEDVSSELVGPLAELARRAKAGGIVTTGTVQLTFGQLMAGIAVTGKTPSELTKGVGVTPGGAAGYDQLVLMRDIAKSNELVMRTAEVILQNAGK